MVRLKVKSSPAITGKLVELSTADWDGVKTGRCVGGRISRTAELLVRVSV
jgi:hypothetical protein